MSCFWGHDWAKWKLYEKDFWVWDKNGRQFLAPDGRPATRTEVRQRRECATCGRVEDELVRG